MSGNGQTMVKLTIDGQEIEVPKGTNLVDAAQMLDVEVPHYCYHPGLSVPANCRICQVEIEGQPKLAFGCRTPVAEGMVVHTASEKAVAWLVNVDNQTYPYFAFFEAFNIAPEYSTSVVVADAEGEVA